MNITEKLEPTGNTMYRRFLESFLNDFPLDNKVELPTSSTSMVSQYDEIIHAVILNNPIITFVLFMIVLL